MAIQETSKKKKRGGGAGNSAGLEDLPEELTTGEEAEEILAAISSSVKGADELLGKLRRYTQPPRPTCGCG